MNEYLKITIKNCNELDNFTLNKLLHNIRYKTILSYNKAMTYMYTFAQENINYKKINGININEEERFGKSHRAWIENRMNEVMDICNSRNVAQTRQFVSNSYKNDVKAALSKDGIFILNFKKDIPILIHSQNYKIFQDNNDYKIEINLFSMKYQKENNIKQISLNIDKIDIDEKSILNKLISGDYKQRSAQIIEDNRKKDKWYLIISFSFEPTKNKNQILGVIGY